MDDFFIDSSAVNISNGIIDNINFERFSALVTVSYTDCINCRRRNRQTIRLAVGNNTRIFDENGNTVPFTDLRTGMLINAVVSSAMTRRIPPQATAFEIQIR